jgi:hypothetical protein
MRKFIFNKLINNIMKKFIVWSLILTMGISLIFITPLLAAYMPNSENQETTDDEVSTNATEQPITQLEKILSPNQIPNFTNVIKQGSDLYGLRKAIQASNQGQTNSQVQAQNKTGSQVQNQNQEAVQNQILEKIAAPQFINMYKNIRQIGNALWGFKKGDNEEDSSNQNIADRLEELKTEIYIQSPSDISLFTNIRKNIEGKMFGILKNIEEIPEKYVSSIRSFFPVAENERECVLKAVAEKDEAIKANNLKFTEDLNTSIEVRSKCQEKALSSIEEDQKEALEICNQEFKISQEQIRKQARDAQESFWESYKTALLECRPQIGTTTPLIINDGGINIF